MLILKDIEYSVENFNLIINELAFPENSYSVVLGPSGSGKSLLLDIIAGHRKIKKGNIILNNINITNTPIYQRNIAYIPTSGGLFPHLTVKKNLLYASIVTQNEFEEIIDLINIRHLLDKKPTTLSSGERQKVALARALTINPRIILLDEPLSAIDAQERYKIILLLRDLPKRNITFIHVTHDFSEALQLATFIIVLNNGTIVQQDLPEKVLFNPSNPFVASLAGIKNIFKGSRKSPQIITIENTNLDFYVNENLNSDKVIILLSSNDIIISKDNIKNTSIKNSFPGIITDIIKGPVQTQLLINVGITMHACITTQSAYSLNLEKGQQIYVSFKASSIKCIPI